MTEQQHRKKVKHFHEPGHFYELKFSCYRRIPILTNDDWRARLSRHIDSAVQRTSFELVAFVFMPEHVHLLVYPTVLEPEISRLLAFIKQRFSKEIRPNDNFWKFPTFTDSLKGLSIRSTKLTEVNSASSSERHGHSPCHPAA